MILTFIQNLVECLSLHELKYPQKSWSFCRNVIDMNVRDICDANDLFLIV